MQAMLLFFAEPELIETRMVDQPGAGGAENDNGKNASAWPIAESLDMSVF
ncbi:hypothetical protein QLH52_21405 [Methylomonas sp. OY6]|uniref:Uncharacterized protein n=1 Tax=Methylomonas defluvii TaxID=3045149 RepID=A0ABU4UL23_9GAMM|nr:hypothetical protein [Methylomonas sp. OY6]MDX8129866.1 hypothetical protein [Methylomonas sp. OY6]